MVPPRFPLLPNPFGVPAPERVWQVLNFIGFGLLFLTTLLAVLVLFERFARERDLQRQQIKWVAIGAPLTAAAILLDAFVPSAGAWTWWRWRVSQCGTSRRVPPHTH